MMGWGLFTVSFRLSASFICPASSRVLFETSTQQAHELSELIATSQG